MLELLKTLKGWLLKMTNIDALELRTQLRNEIQSLGKQLLKVRQHASIEYSHLYAPFAFKPAPVPKDKVKLITQHPIAETSVDHLFPRGTANDNTRWPRFVRCCEETFNYKTLNFLDLGCAGGGLVRDFALRGHFGMGLEGSDYSKNRLRAEWRTIPGHLFTCDIAEEFTIVSRSDSSIITFDVISAWDVLEHIEKQRLPIVLDNVARHLSIDGVFIGTVSLRKARIQPGAEEVNHHATVETRQWWEETFTLAGFFYLPDHKFQPKDYPRGNGILFPADFFKHPEIGFHFVMRRG